MLVALQEFITRHLYTALLLATLIEGVGLPLPAEVLFVSAAIAVHRGDASLGAVILAACVGNMAGALLGFGLAYAGGQRLVHRAARTLRLKHDALPAVERFFARYGPGAIFLSRFIGFVRVPAMYTAGAARMSPWQYTLYIGAAVLIWNTGWAWLAYRFGARLPHLLHRAAGRGGVWVVTLLAVFVVGGLLFRWIRRRHPIGS